MAANTQQSIAGPGSTGNNNHQSVGVAPQGQLIAVEFVVEVAGATPTVTFKLQGTFDPGTVVDGSANWFDLILLPSDNETAAVSSTVTATGAYARYLAQSIARFVPRVRLVTSANTNITYRANLRTQYRNS